jgi:hypothetical protein
MFRIILIDSNKYTIKNRSNVFDTNEKVFKYDYDVLYHKSCIATMPFSY